MFYVRYSVLALCCFIYLWPRDLSNKHLCGTNPHDTLGRTSDVFFRVGFRVEAIAFEHCGPRGILLPCGEYLWQPMFQVQCFLLASWLG